MSINDLAIKAKDLHEIKAMINELPAEADTIEDVLKAHMDEQGMETITAGSFKLSYKTISSSRFDSSAFKTAMPDLAERFMKATVTRRFTIA